MKKIASVLIFILFLWSCSNDDITQSDLDNSSLGKNEKLYIPDIQSEVTLKGDMISFENEEDLLIVLKKIQSSEDTQKSASTRLSTTSNPIEYTQILADNDFNFKSSQFTSLYDEFNQAMNEAELYCDTEEGYYEFKKKYPSLYFPEQSDDYSAYLPVSDPTVAKLLNKNGEIEIGGQIKDLKDIKSYDQLIELGLIPSENELIQTRATTNQVNYFYERCNNRKLWVKMKLAPGSGLGVYQDIIADVSFRKKGAFGAWYNYSSQTSLGWVNGASWSKSGYSSHDYKWARTYSNGKPNPFRGTMWVQFRGFGSKCGGTKYQFSVNI